MERSARTDDDVAAGLDHVCARLDQIRETLTLSSDGVGVLDTVLAAVAQDRNPAAALEDLHRALRAAGDTLGVFGGARSGIKPPGIESSSGRDSVYVCPRDAHPCARHAWPSAAAEHRCKISDQELRRVWL
ncbi:hypothetical protein AB0E59_07805 [Lentzea sp. NPDC034063]|uniref:hypothetical protein n=1 Tax=unclassified Lentzea TaxID=2643253 RepID=UPI00340ADB05